jgi:putative FmdB family regulatory protein
MPTYEYECTSCEVVEQLVFGLDEVHSEQFCKECGYKLSRVYKFGAVTFNGDGWAGKEK